MGCVFMNMWLTWQRLGQLSHRKLIQKILEMTIWGKYGSPSKGIWKAWGIWADQRASLVDVSPHLKILKQTNFFVIHHSFIICHSFIIFYSLTTYYFFAIFLHNDYMLLCVVNGGWRREIGFLSVQNLLSQDEPRWQPASIILIIIMMLKFDHFDDHEKCDCEGSKSGHWLVIVNIFSMIKLMMSLQSKLEKNILRLIIIRLS